MNLSESSIVSAKLLWRIGKLLIGKRRSTLWQVRKSSIADAPKNYWKAIAELIPHEVPTIEKRGKKEKEKQPSILVIQGPKPGKPTDMSRMRHILLKLKHNPPPHMKLEVVKDAKESPPPTSAASAPPPTSAASPTSVASAPPKTAAVSA
ncbi:hypothetical protein Ancab_032222 [Ancistrocladus abbreviatus]